MQMITMLLLNGEVRSIDMQMITVLLLNVGVRSIDYADDYFAVIESRSSGG